MKPDRAQWLALLAGAAAFFAATGGAIVDPRRVDWLLASPDPAAAWLGWEFFRQAPFWQFPFGASPAYGLEISSSVVFSDSVPLLAFLFRPFSALLPAPFQYLGLWILACFLLQGWLAYRLLRRLHDDRALALLGSGFFLLAPLWLYRLGGHFALMGHWLLLAALLLYFTPRAPAWRWGALLCVTALVHFYLLAMVGAIWAAHLWRNRAERGALAGAALGLAATAATMLFAGYFMVGNAQSSLGFGLYRMNLLAPLDPDGQWSRLLPDLPGGPGDYEGFAFAGLGVLLLAPAAAWAFARRPALDGRLAAVALALCALAVSNRVAFGEHELLAYEVPALLQPLADMLRSSGRLFWPVYYLLLAGILAFAWRLPRRAALALTVAALAVQVVDSGAALRGQRERLAPPPWASPLASPLWDELAQRYRRVVLVPPANTMEGFLPWAEYAGRHGLAVNSGYFARVDTGKLAAARAEVEAAVLGNRLQRDSLYVFASDALWNLALAQPRTGGDLAGVLDGFRILAPGLAGCRCDLAALRPAEPAGAAPGERLSFARGGNGAGLPRLGWEAPEDWGMRSRAAEASVVLRLKAVPAQALTLALEGRALEGSAEVEVLADGAPVGVLAYTGAAQTQTVRIPRPRASLLMLKFRFREARPFGLIALRLD